jgi:hypothetical protein
MSASKREEPTPEHEYGVSSLHTFAGEDAVMVSNIDCITIFLKFHVLLSWFGEVIASFF